MSAAALLQFACLALFATLLFAAAVQDLRTMTIANDFSLAIVGLFAISALAGLASNQLSLSTLGMTLTCAAGVFAVGVAAFTAGALGGGDVKMLAAASLFAGPTQLLDFLSITALAGGLMGIAIVAGAPIGQPVPGSGSSFRSRLRAGLPYGPAIAAGGLWLAASRAWG